MAECKIEVSHRDSSEVTVQRDGQYVRITAGSGYERGTACLTADEATKLALFLHDTARLLAPPPEAATCQSC